MHLPVLGVFRGHRFIAGDLDVLRILVLGCPRVIARAADDRLPVNISGLSNKFLNLSIVSLEFHSCIVLGEFPVNCFALLIASGGPC
jgi:hypothetical protein